MILNMSYGTSQAQIIEFTISGNDPVREITIPNVILSENTVNGMMLYPTTNLAENQDGCVYHAWKSPDMAANIIGTKEYNMISAGSGQYFIREDVLYEIPNPLVYDPTNQTLYICVANTGDGLYAGNYKLVVW